MRRVALSSTVVALLPFVVGACSFGRADRTPARIRTGLDGSLTINTASGAQLVLEPDSLNLDASVRRWELAGAIGERVAFDLRLHAAAGAFDALDISISPLKTTHPTDFPSRFQIYHVHTVPTKRRPGWAIRFDPNPSTQPTVPDVVVPRRAPIGGLPAPLMPGTRLHILAEVEIPDEATPGSYAANVTIHEGAQTLAQWPLRLTVWPVALRKPRGVELLFELDVSQWGSENDDRALSPAVETLRSHGVVPVLTGVYPVAKVNRDSRLSVDWSAFDRVVAQLMDGSQPAWCRIPFDANFPAGAIASEPHDSATSQLATDYLRACAEHFSSRGWLDRSYVEVPIPDPAAGDPIDAIRRTAGWARLADRRLRTLVTFPGNRPTGMRWSDMVLAEVDKLIDIWCPPARLGAERTTPRPQTTWMRLDRPPFSGSIALGGRPSTTRSVPWQARRYGLPRVNVGDGGGVGLLYPGEPFGLDHPVASMRLKSLRRGLDDLSYLELLDSLGEASLTMKLMDAIAPFALSDAYGYHIGDARGIGWAMNDEPWSLARRIMASDVMEVSRGDTPTRATSLDQSVRWQRLNAETRLLSLAVEGVRVRARDREGRSRIECLVTMENRTIREVGGRLAFGELPIGWRAMADPPIVAPIPPSERRRAVLMAEADGLSWNADGVINVPVVLRSDDGKTHVTSARVSYIASRRSSRPITIDGDLSDWTLGSGNSAAGFVSVSGSTVAPTVTRCLVEHDANNLYFGIHCAAPTDAFGQAVHQNIVHYEDMIPADGDVVEILLDPTNARTHAPEDLYHIVIKSAGAVFERGIGTTPSIGPRRLWAADIRYASRMTDGNWTIELSIPFDAFDDATRGTNIWGLNVSRFERDRSLYATWSGARYNVYDPGTLGNLMIPPPSLP